MIKLIERYFNKSPYLLFLPFGIIYILLVVFLHSDNNFGDESRYLTYAGNLLNGYYSPPSPDINLWSGPGYPLMILAFVWLKLPLLSITLFNAVLQYLSLVFLFFTLRTYASKALSASLSLFWACYYPAFVWWMPLIYTESLTIFLIVLIAYLLSRAKLDSYSVQKKHLIAAGVLIGFLVLTKIAFGYVLLLLLPCSIICYFIRKNLQSKYIFLCLSIAFLINVPYLTYTYSLTHKMFYWGSAGGANLYWMSTPYEGEYGEWHGAELQVAPQANSQVAKNHAKELAAINALPSIERDEEFTRIAIQNIKDHPGKYLRNCLANASRLLFDFPISFSSPTKLFPVRIFPTCLLLPFAIISFFLSVFNFRLLTTELKFAFLFFSGYLAISLLASAYNRQLVIVVPVILLFIAYTFGRFLKTPFFTKNSEHKA